MNRRELFGFLSSSVKGEEISKVVVMRPPYFEDSNAFDSECQKCDGVCATSCQEQIIIIQDDKTPRLDLSKSGCTYCDDCAVACQHDVLFVEHKALINATIAIDTGKCMSYEGVMCFSCKDPCYEDAIEFQGMFSPTINQDKCTSCGFCISRCPSYAIEIKEKV
jgi:ferredoxin-type protein NapF